MEETIEYFGIDLGTTNSCIAAVCNGKAEVIPIEGETTTPSVVAYADNQWIVGHKARNHLRIRPDEGVASIKRKMDDLEYRISLGGEQLSPIEISAKILTCLAKGAEPHVGKPVKKVVITVPAWFKDSQRQATLAAGKKAGLEVLQIINEPTAAAIAHETAHISEGDEEKWIVYDLGGGTFDVSVLSVTSATHEVMASVGNSFLGGDDFDRRLAEKLCSVIRDKYNVDPQSDPVAEARLFHLAESAKIALSDCTTTAIKEPLLINDQTYLLDINLTRQEFEEIIQDLVDSTLEKVAQALGEARLSAKDINRLLLVGGSTRIPVIADAIKERFNLDGESWVDPDRSVAMGAAIQTAITSGAFFEREVVDISPHSLGLACLGHEDELHGPNLQEIPLTFAPLVRRSSRLPASAVKSFFKMHEGQQEVEIAVYQGESSNTRNNTFIGKFTAEMKNSQSRKIDVRFSYDISGTIQISVEEEGSGNVRHYSMDLSRTSDENSEESRLVLTDDEDFETGKIENNEVTNFLVEKVSKKLISHPDDSIAKELAEYCKYLKLEDDEKIDILEERLYDWLEEVEGN